MSESRIFRAKKAQPKPVKKRREKALVPSPSVFFKTVPLRTFAAKINSPPGLFSENRRRGAFFVFYSAGYKANLEDVPAFADSGKDFVAHRGIEIHKSDGIILL